MITTIVVDCDGCLTDGRKHIGPEGEREIISFHSRDNTVIRRLIEEGFRVVVVTASASPIIRRYWTRYGVEVYYSKEKEKLEGIDWELALGIGDDVLDAPFLRRCALSFVPADAHPLLRMEFQVLRSRGGGGIMEEVEEWLTRRLSADTFYQYIITHNSNGKAH